CWEGRGCSLSIRTAPPGTLTINQRTARGNTHALLGGVVSVQADVGQPEQTRHPMPQGELSRGEPGPPMGVELLGDRGTFHQPGVVQDALGLVSLLLTVGAPGEHA